MLVFIQVRTRTRAQDYGTSLHKKQTQIRKRRHGAERGFALTRLAKSSLIRHAVAVAFLTEIIGIFILQNIVCRFVFFVA